MFSDGNTSTYDNNRIRRIRSILWSISYSDSNNKPSLSQYRFCTENVCKCVCMCVRNGALLCWATVETSASRFRRRRVLHQAQTEGARSPSSRLPSLISGAFTFSCMMDQQLLLPLGQTDSRGRWMCQSVSQRRPILVRCSVSSGLFKVPLAHWGKFVWGRQEANSFCFVVFLLLPPSYSPLLHPSHTHTTLSWLVLLRCRTPRVNLQFGTERVNK